MMFRILLRNLGNTTVAMKFSDMEMVEKIFLSPYTCIGSDGLGAGSGYPAHPRAYANQVKVFSDFVREKHLVSLEEAVRMRSKRVPAMVFWDILPFITTIIRMRLPPGAEGFVRLSLAMPRASIEQARQWSGSKKRSLKASNLTYP